MNAPLNLARRPFGNERLPTFGLWLGIALLLATSVRHFQLAFSLRPGTAGGVEREVSGLEREIARLNAEAATLQVSQASKETVAEWQAVRQLVDRRVFSWTGLLAALEGALPPGVRLVSLRPSTRDGVLMLMLAVVGRDVDDVLAIPKALRAQGEFGWAFLESYAETNDGVTASCSVRYLGRSPAAAGVAK